MGWYYRINRVQILATSHVTQGPEGELSWAVGTWKDFIPDCSLGGGPTWQQETKRKLLDLLGSRTSPSSTGNHCQPHVPLLRQSNKRYLVIWVWFPLSWTFVSAWMNQDDRQFPSRNAILKVRQVLIPHCQHLPPCLLISQSGIKRPLEMETRTAGALISPLTLMGPSSH